MLGLDIVALVLMGSVLAGVLIRRWPGQPVRTGLAIFLAGLSVSLVIHLAALLVASHHPSDPAITCLVNLFIGTYILMTMTACFLVIILAGVLGQGLDVAVRTGLVLWLLFQIPIWQGDLFTIGTGTDLGVLTIHLNLELAGTGFVLGVMLFFQVLTVGLAYHYRRRIHQEWLVAGLVLFQIGQVLTILLIDQYRFLTIWLAAPMAVLIGCGLIQAGRHPSAS